MNWKTDDEIADELRELRALKDKVRRTNSYGEDNRAAIEAQCTVLEGRMSLDQILIAWGDKSSPLFSVFVHDAALNVYDWMSGTECAFLNSAAWSSGQGMSTSEMVAEKVDEAIAAGRAALTAKEPESSIQELIFRVGSSSQWMLTTEKQAKGLMEIYREMAKTNPLWVVDRLANHLFRSMSGSSYGDPTAQRQVPLLLQEALPVIFDHMHQVGNVTMPHQHEDYETQIMGLLVFHLPASGDHSRRLIELWRAKGDRLPIDAASKFVGTMCGRANARSPDETDMLSSILPHVAEAYGRLADRAYAAGDMDVELDARIMGLGAAVEALIRATQSVVATQIGVAGATALIRNLASALMTRAEALRAHDEGAFDFTLRFSLRDMNGWEAKKFAIQFPIQFEDGVIRVRAEPGCDVVDFPVT